MAKLCHVPGVSSDENPAGLSRPGNVSQSASSPPAFAAKGVAQPGDADTSLVLVMENGVAMKSSPEIVAHQPECIGVDEEEEVVPRNGSAEDLREGKSAAVADATTGSKEGRDWMNAEEPKGLAGFLAPSMTLPAKNVSRAGVRKRRAAAQMEAGAVAATAATAVILPDGEKGAEGAGVRRTATAIRAATSVPSGGDAVIVPVNASPSVEDEVAIIGGFESTGTCTLLSGEQPSQRVQGHLPNPLSGADREGIMGREALGFMKKQARKNGIGTRARRRKKQEEAAAKAAAEAARCSASGQSRDKAGDKHDDDDDSANGERNIVVNGQGDAALLEEGGVMEEGRAQDVCEENDEGNVEYKLKLVDPPLDRLEHLFTQVGFDRVISSWNCVSYSTDPLPAVVFWRILPRQLRVTNSREQKCPAFNGVSPTMVIISAFAPKPSFLRMNRVR